MKTDWYVVPKVGSGTLNDSQRAKYTHDPDVEGTAQYPITSDTYIVRYLATQEKHDTIQADSDTRQLDDDEVENRLNEAFNEALSIDEWNSRFDPGQGL